MTEPARPARTSARPSRGRRGRRRPRRGTPAATPAPATAATTDAEQVASQSESSQRAPRPEHFAPASRAPYAVVAIQATGIHPKTERLLSIALLTVDSAGQVVDTWHRVVNPEDDPGPTHLHGLEPKDFQGAPTFSDIMPKLAAGLEGRTLIAHRAPMVWGFIVTESKRARRRANRQRNAGGRRNRRNVKVRVPRMPQPSAIVDTLATARRQNRSLDDVRLRGVARSYGLDVPAPTATSHGATVAERTRTLADATTTLELFLAQGGLDAQATIALHRTEDLMADSVGLQRSVVRVEAMTAPRPTANPGRYRPGGRVEPGMEFVIAPEVAADPDELIAAGVSAGLVYSEKVTRESSLLVCNWSADKPGQQLTGKAMHAQRKEIPLVSDEAFLRLVQEMG